LAGHATLADGRPFACADCHTEKLAVFDVAVCATCHREADAAYMQRHVADFGAACLGCHDGADRYSKWRFDHNRLPFPLTGKHAGVTCAGCHANARTVADLQAAPQTCAGCHQDPTYAWCKMPSCGTGPTPDGLRNMAGRTHLPAGPRRAGCQLVQNVPPRPAQGLHLLQLPLRQVGNLRYVYGEHTPADIQRKHIHEGIPDFANCMKCHANGQKEEGKGGD
jgi:hypothetical protein